MAELEVDTKEIAAEVESGEYYAKAREWYSALYHAPIPERCFFIVVMALALLTTYFAVTSFLALQPINPAVPFVVVSHDVFEEVPSIRHIALPREAPDSALMRFLVENYVKEREEYNFDRYGRDVSGVRGQSDAATYAAYQQLIDPQNPRSPVALYERHTQRNIWVRSTLVHASQDPHTAVVEFTATTIHGREVKKSNFAANITFRYSPIGVKENGNAAPLTITPMGFVVTGYEVKESSTQ